MMHRGFYGSSQALTIDIAQYFMKIMSSFNFLLISRFPLGKKSGSRSGLKFKFRLGRRFLYQHGNNIGFPNGNFTIAS